MDHLQQTQQTEKIIVEMLEFLESSSDEENDLQQIETEKSFEEIQNINEGINDNATVGIQNNIYLKGNEKPIARELMKLKQQLQADTKQSENLILNTASSEEVDDIFPTSADFVNFDWQYKLENHCRRNYSNTYMQEIHKAIYQDTTGHPPSGSADYYKAAQNYGLYGKHFLDFPANLQMLLNDRNFQNLHTSESENAHLFTNFGNCLYSKPSAATRNNLTSPTGGLTTPTSAATYQICKNTQGQTRANLSANTGNPTSYGIFLGNKVTYVAGTPPTTPSLIYNQHSATTANFISNSLANAALATSPTILYTNPMFTTTTQQYLTQSLNTAALAANCMQTSTVGTNGSCAGVYERLVYAQILQQHLYQTQQAAAVAAMFQHNQRVAVAAAAARHSGNVMTVSSSRSSPQHLTAQQTISNSNGLNLSTCNRQARSSSPSDLVGIKSQSSIVVAATEPSKSSKSSSD